MHSHPTLSASERRDNDRIPLEILLNEYVSDRLHRVMTTNISPTGLFVNRTFTAGHRRLQFGREHRYVQLEFALPGTGETIWAKGEVRYDELGLCGRAVDSDEAMVHGTGIHLLALARGHARLLRDYVTEHRRARLERLLDQLKQNRSH